LREVAEFDGLMFKYVKVWMLDAQRKNPASVAACGGFWDALPNTANRALVLSL